jgi:long-subunit fatty acid transport protein
MIRHIAPKAIFTIVTAVMAVHSQSVLGARYPLGIPRITGSGTAVSMGGAATAAPLDHHVLLANPANLGRIDKTAFSSLLLLDGLRIKEGDKHSNHLSIAPTQLAFAFPLRPAGTVGFSVSKRTDANVKLRSNPMSEPGGLQQVSLHRSGGLTGWEIGFGRAIGSWLHVGATYQRIYLSIDSTFMRELTDVSGASERDSTHTVFRGNGFRAGILVPLGDFHIGLSGSHVFEGPLKKTAGTYPYRRTDPIKGTAATRKATLELPSSVSLGLAWRGSSQWLVASDASVTAWRTYAAGGLLPGTDRDYASSFSLGAQFIPAPNLLAPKYWETIRYRSGFRVTALPLDDNTEAAFTVGTGLPLKGGGLLDLSLEVGQRSDKHLDDFSETFVRFGIGFNGGRTWSRSRDVNY